MSDPRLSPLAPDVDEVDEVDVKKDVDHIEKSIELADPRTAALQAEADWIRSLTPEEFDQHQKKLLRKIDLRLLPTLFILLILNYLDRNALASARVQGIEKDLGMKGNDFNVAISILFAGYILGQVPSNLILSRVRPSIYLSGFVALWGQSALAQPRPTTLRTWSSFGFSSALPSRPTSPARYFCFLLGTPRKSSHCGLPLSVLKAMSRTSSELTGAGVQGGMDGLAGIASWRWLFILEGAITVAAAIAAAFILPDYPATTKWLNDKEKAIAIYRLEKDTGVKDDDTMTLFQSFKTAVVDYKLWLLAMIIVTKTTAGAVTQFIPTVVNTFGMNKVTTLLLTAPPYLVAAVLALTISWSSDRRPERCYHLLAPIVFGMVGFIIAATTKATAPRYFSLFLMVGGLFGSYNVALAWISSTFPRPRAKRAAAYATINSLGNIAQIWSPYLYDSSFGPSYTIAFVTNTIMSAVAVLFCLILRWCLARENRKMEREEAEQTEMSQEGASMRIRYVL
ncbi:hypothetical protein EHS25_000823 [Saitozyma podzolica]|uniref:Major facilitator superfamily (MFS) profile domain-containing protein n=1 Tax=Saitozyma podzolica TaxID=1890683 RepID=A0A427YXC5_9TREE|nr:hypothetical protein EHS25_000823 [Saitozyma podzolica]